jgi:radical SAM protein with 4Fe4S-binding SPASM domain
LVDIVARLREQTPIENLALSGGEPLLRNDMPELVAYIEKLGVNVVVITNGSSIGPELISRLGEAMFEVTLLSYRPEVHDRLAGCTGSWEAAVQGMAHLRKARRAFVVVFVATKENWLDLPKTVELAIALGAEGLMFNRLNLGSRTVHQARSLLPTPPMLVESLGTLEDLAGKYGLPVAASVVIEPCVVDIRRYRNIHFGWCPRAGEEAYFTIDGEGDVRICNHSPVVLGNLLREPFSTIYRDHPHVRAYRETWPRECESCAPELRELCRGGCRAAAEQCLGTLEHVDPFVTFSLDGGIDAADGTPRRKYVGTPSTTS